MNNSSKRAKTFKVILILSIILVIITAFGLSSGYSNGKPISVFIGVILVFLPSIFSIYALYCILDNQDAQLKKADKIIEMLEKSGNEEKLKNINFEHKHIWVCPKCGTKNDAAKETCEKCGYRI
ncbi:zinc finger Ran-binding domain-containing protein [Eubacterium sp.]|uniref:zinc finger Ran-binding domain-containing protein n=1 Tax=Eubacterium sp. TaxID=142586 RepID=UPI002A7ECAA1|nr:zinc finger Ran-binding domain-containing protein [Eubacterium sp.]MDY3811131.1 zinc finger Ran-binding domain-containing protein [Eubacterium sp.]